MRTRPFSFLLSGTALVLLLACGGTPQNTPRDSGPEYVNPTTTGWALVKNTSLSTGRHIVLDLVGPAGASGLGVALNLDLGTDAAKATWAPVKPSNQELVANLSYDLGSGSQAIKASSSGGVLRLGVFSKGLSAPLTPYSAPLLQVALDLSDGLKSGDTVKVIPTLADELSAGGVRPIGLAIGTIQAK